MSHIEHPLVARQSRAAFIRTLLNGLQHIPQLSHPKAGVSVRTRFSHTRNICQLARLLHGYFDCSPSPLWPQLCVRLACHDIGHTPYGHAGERVVQDRYDPDFCNTTQSQRYMFAGTDDWPETVTPFAWYRCAPIYRLPDRMEQRLQVLIDFFDDLENAVGDALDLHTLGQSTAYEFLMEDCSWSKDVPFRRDQALAGYLKQIVLQEFAPTGFSELAESVTGDKGGCLRSVGQLRQVISQERLKCARICEIDSMADKRIPLLFDLAADYLHKQFNGHCDDKFVRRVAIDMIASTNELELN